MTYARVRDTSVYDRVRAMYDMEEFVTHLSYVNTHETGASFEAVCNTLQHTAIHCNTLLTREEPVSRPRATHCNTLQHTATHCNTLLTREEPVLRPRALRKVKTMPPPMMILSHLPMSDSITPIFDDTLEPPTIAANGRFGSST